MVFSDDPETGLAGPREVLATWPNTDSLAEFGVGGRAGTCSLLRPDPPNLDFIRTRRADIDGPRLCTALRSFSADTEVLLADGTAIAIADVVVGDVVFAHDPETGVSGAREVLATWPHTDTLVEFEVGDGTVTTTEDHDFWNVTDNAWQETQHIDAGDLLLTADGATVEAGTLLWDTAHVAPAFDLTIDEIHTYHVTAGDEHVLVHNNTPCGDLGDDWVPQDTSTIPGSNTCRQCAAEIVERLGGGNMIRVTSDRSPFLPDYRGQTSGWSDHVVVELDGRIYDAFGDQVGLPIAEWLELWDLPEALVLEPYAAG